MNLRRGQESLYHLQAKQTVGSLFNESDWSVFYEQGYADVVVLHHASRFTAAIEIESSTRNVVQNIKRDIQSGCEAVATVSLKRSNDCQIRNLISRRFSTQPIRIFSATDSGLHALKQWLESKARAQIKEQPQ